MFSGLPASSRLVCSTVEACEILHSIKRFMSGRSKRVLAGTGIVPKVKFMRPQYRDPAVFLNSTRRSAMSICILTLADKLDILKLS